MKNGSFLKPMLMTFLKLSSEEKRVTILPQQSIEGPISSPWKRKGLEAECDCSMGLLYQREALLDSGGI